MATSFDIVEDYALTTVDDYKLTALFTQSEAQFQTFVDGMLIAAVPFFTQCKQDLAYDTNTREFISTLTNMEVAILGGFWIMNWFDRYVRTSSQFQAKLQSSSSFRNFSEAQNLKEKQASVNEIREKTYQLITDYLLQDIDTLY